MVSLYCTLIINKRRTFDQVPEKIQGEVETRLRELGYDVNGDPVAGEVYPKEKRQQRCKVADAYRARPRPHYISRDALHRAGMDYTGRI